MNKKEIYAAKAKGFRQQARKEFDKCKDLHTIEQVNNKHFKKGARLNNLALNYQDLAVDNEIPTVRKIEVGYKAFRKI